MKLRVIWPGRTKDRRLAGLLTDYAARIRHFLPIEIAESRKDPVLSLNDSDFAIALDPRGKSWTSEQFAEFLRKHLASNPRNIAFMVGDHAGLSPAARKRADLLWSLAPVTLTHDITRLVLLEQIYRALTIIHNHPYSR